MEQPNVNYIESLSGDDTVFRQKLIDTIKGELPGEIAVYLEHISAGNFTASAQDVHKLKHKISVLGMEKSYYIAEKYEQNLKDNSDTLRDDFDKILQVMKGYVETL